MCFVMQCYVKFHGLHIFHCTYLVDMHQINTVENPAICKEEEGEKYSENSKDRWYDDYDNLSEPPDAGEMVDDQSDISDYEETYIKKKKKKVCLCCNHV